MDGSFQDLHSCGAKHVQFGVDSILSWSGYWIQKLWTLHLLVLPVYKASIEEDNFSIESTVPGGVEFTGSENVSKILPIESTSIILQYKDW